MCLRAKKESQEKGQALCLSSSRNSGQLVRAEELQAWGSAPTCLGLLCIRCVVINAGGLVLLLLKIL